MREVTITAEAPILLGTAGGTSYVTDTHLHVPGSVLRGALAARWIAEIGVPSNLDDSLKRDFVSLFERDVRYGPAYAQGSVVEPVAVHRCKYRPNPACDVFVADRAHHETDVVCGECDGPLDGGKGRVLGVHSGEWASTQIEGPQQPGAWAKERAKDGDLFARRYLPAGTVFTGHIAGTHPWLASPPSMVWLGGRRSTAGRARFGLGVEQPTHVGERADGMVHIQLQSPGVFVDEAGRPLTRFPLDQIARLLGLASVKVAGQWTRLTRVGGWHAASRLNKPTDVALAAGSSILLGVDTGRDALAALCEHGLGLRRAEGYGWITVNPGRWAPPATDTRMPVVAAAPALADLLASADLAAWLSPRLKEVAVRSEQGETVQADTLLAHGRTRGLTSDQRKAIREIMALPPRQLNDVIVLLETEGPA